MRVFVLVTDSARGGTPTRLRDLVVGLRDRGHVVRFSTLMPGGSVSDDVRDAGIDVADLRMRGWGDLPRACARLRRDLASFRPDVLQTALFHANVIGRFVGRTLNVPIVSGYQSMDDDMGVARRALDRWTARLARRHVAVSERVADRVSERVRVPRPVIDVIPIGKCPPDLTGQRDAVRREWGIPLDAPVIGFVGRLHPVKDLPTLLAAHSLLPGAPWVLVVGDGPERPLLDGLERVVTVGEQSQVTRFLEAMDVFALPSKWEGMPGALVEAMWAGRPVVATDVGGVSDVVTHGVDGLLVRPGDAAGLAAALERALDDAASLGAAARATAVRSFTLDAMLEAHERCYRKAIE